jgi:hypothetical protein
MGWIIFRLYNKLNCLFLRSFSFVVVVVIVVIVVIVSFPSCTTLVIQLACLGHRVPFKGSFPMPGLS